MSGPLRPEEAKKIIPPFVLEAVNELIQENLTQNNTRAIVYQKHIVERVKTKTDQTFDFAWLEIEPIYREAGWVVVYDRPGYCEDYDAYFIFKMP